MSLFKKTGHLVLGACIASAAGCANMSQNEWLNQENIGTVAGAAAGILLGSQVGSGSGRTAAMLVGALAGGMLGKTIGAKLDDRDRQALAAQTDDLELQAHFAPLAKSLTEQEPQIVAEFKAVQGQPADIGGYYLADTEKVTAVMRPSATFNAALDAVRA